MFHPQGPSFLELAVEALSSTERGYDRLAPKFDHTPFRTSDALLSAVAPHIGPRQSIDTALDICCGTGAAMRMLRPLCRHRVVGLDFSEGMLDICRQRMSTAPGDAAVDLVRADALNMPLESRFDVAVCFGALGHILRRDQGRFIDQIARVLRPGGRFIFVTAYRPPLSSLSYWLARAFNACMHVRNALIHPPFIMYYLRFLLPEITHLLQERGFRIAITTEGLPEPRLHLVIATRLATEPERETEELSAA